MRVGGAGCAQGAGVLRCEYWLDAANERAWLIADASAVSHDPLHHRLKAAARGPWHAWALLCFGGR